MHAGGTLARRVSTRPRARLVAILALVSSALGIFFVVWGIVDRPGLLVAIVLLGPAFLALVFTAVTSQGHKRLLSAIAAAAVGLAVIGITIGENVARDGWRYQGLLGLGLLGVAAAGARYALMVPPPTLEEVLSRSAGPRPVDHPVLVINPASGGGKAEQFDLVATCRELGVDTRLLRPGDDLERIAREAAADGADALGMAGGDGSLACVAAVAIDHQIPFVCVPAGTRNHFALDLGLDRNDPRQALAAFVDGEERVIDYGTVNGQMFLNNVSLGVYAAIVEQDSYRDAKLDTALQLLPKLMSDGGPWFDLHFDVPGHGRLEEAAILQVSNNPYAEGELGRRGRLDAGELGVLTADPKRVADLVSLTMLAAARRAERSSALWVWTCTSFTVESGQDVQSAGVDGETVTLRTPLEFRIVPKGLRVLVPPGTRVGLEEQQLGAGGTLSGLVGVALGTAGSDT